jgi:ATP-dependent Clp protease adaptor protein ClpS
MSTEELNSPLSNTEEKEGELHSLILYNDEVNTFDFVIETLMDVCEHDFIQAENCAWIAHFKGKCAVKKGPFDDLKPRHDEMSNRTLTVEIK